MNARDKELAEQAGYKPLSPPTFADELNEIFMRKFAELIRADEREACAKVCDEEYKKYDYFDLERVVAKLCADAIRARGVK